MSNDNANDNHNGNDKDSDDDDNNAQSFLSKKRKIMPTCQLCKATESKYVCPRCQYKTCSVQCVKDHKKKFNCTGLRDKYKKVTEQKDYTEKAFYRDLNYLSTTISDINTSNKKVFSLFEKTSAKDEEDKKNQPYSSKIQKNFKRICKKFRSITIHRCPEHLQRAKENQSHLDSGTKKIYWTVKFTFLNRDNCEQLFVGTQFDDEVTSIKDIIDYLNKHKEDASNTEVLSVINEDNWDSKYGVYMRINSATLDAIDKNNYECFNKGYYKQCDTTMKLKDVLKGQNIYEYPEFYFIIKTKQ